MWIVFHSPDEKGRFGPYGGSFVPETLSHPLRELNEAYLEARKDPTFANELSKLLRTFAGRPTELYSAEQLTKQRGGAKIYLKREDLCILVLTKLIMPLDRHYLLKEWGKIESSLTGVSQHGIATASVCAHFGFECIIYMGAEDMRRQALNVFRMELSGAKVIGVEAGNIERSYQRSNARLGHQC